MFSCFTDSRGKLSAGLRLSAEVPCGGPDGLWVRRPSLSRLGTCVHDLVPGPSGTLVGCGCGHLCPAQRGGGERYHSGHWAPGTQDLEVRPCPARLPRRLGRLTGLCTERRPLSVMAPGREDRLPCRGLRRGGAGSLPQLPSPRWAGSPAPLFRGAPLPHLQSIFLPGGTGAAV